MKKHLILLTVILNTFLITAPLNAQMGDYQTDMELFFKDIFQKNKLNQLEDYLKSYAGNVNEIRSKKNATCFSWPSATMLRKRPLKSFLEQESNPIVMIKSG